MRRTALLLLLLLVGTARAEGLADSLTATDKQGRTRVAAALRAGAAFTAEETKHAEERLAADPKDVDARLSLIGCRSVSMEAEGTVRPLVLGLIEHHPRASVADAVAQILSTAGSDEATWDAVQQAWARLVAEQPDDASLLGNAGVFLASHPVTKHRRSGLDLLLDATRREPAEIRWLNALCRHAGDLAPSERYRVLAALHDALPLAERRSLRLEPTGELLATAMAQAAWDAGEAKAAEEHATDILAWATPKGLGWDHGNVVHDMSILLGKMALARGDVAAAKRHLLAAGATPGSPQLDSFGPDWTLAEALLERGERAAVLEYIQSCGRFWTSGQNDLAKWRRSIEAGERPDFPVRRATPPEKKPDDATSDEPEGKLEPTDDERGPDRPLVGLWESVPKGAGIGGAWLFQPDGRLTISMVLMADAKYAVEDGAIVLTSLDAKETERFPPGRPEGDTWTMSFVDHQLVLKRHGAKPNGAPDHEGVWTHPDATGTEAFQQFTRDGRWSRRVGLPGAKHGTYEVRGAVLTTRIDGQASESTFRIRGDRMTMTDTSGKTCELSWGGDTLWYAWYGGKAAGGR